MDIPGAFVWAVLAFVTNFIPNIGFIIGVIPPALIGLLDGGVEKMIAVIVVYTVINFVIQSVIQPRVVGDAVGLSPTLTILSVVFWTWIVGPLGAVLAVPLTLLTRALLVEADPRAWWALPLIAGEPEKDSEPEPKATTDPLPAEPVGWASMTHDAGEAGGHDSTEAAVDESANAALRRLPRWLQPVLGWLLSRWLGRIAINGLREFVRLDIFDRSMTIAAQFFSSVIPILILLMTWASTRDTDRLADALNLPEEYPLRPRRRDPGCRNGLVRHRRHRDRAGLGN